MLQSDALKIWYRTCCVNSTASAINAMVDRAREVTYRTFRKHVSAAVMDEWAANMGYDVGSRRGGLRLKADWHVSYHKSVYRGNNCWYIRHSAIEYIFY